MEKVVMFPGSFDPPTMGHLDLVERSLKIFDKIHIVIANNIEKKYLFSIEQRLAMLKEIYKDDSRVVIESSDDLIINYAKNNNIKIVIRGIRAVNDFAFEFELALLNKKLSPEIDVLFLPTDVNNFLIRSSKIKEMIKFNADISSMVPEIVIKEVKKLL